MHSTLSSRLHLLHLSDPTPERKRREIRHETTSARAPFLSVSRLLLRALLVLYMYRALGSDRTWARAHVSRSPPPPPHDYGSPSRLASGRAQRVTRSLCSAFFSFLALLDSNHTRTVHPSLEYACIASGNRAAHGPENYTSAVVRAGPSEPEPTTRAQSRERLDSTRLDSKIFRRSLHYTVDVQLGEVRLAPSPSPTISRICGAGDEKAARNKSPSDSRDETKCAR